MQCRCVSYVNWSHSVRTVPSHIHCSSLISHTTSYHLIPWPHSQAYPSLILRPHSQAYPSLIPRPSLALPSLCGIFLTVCASLIMTTKWSKNKLLGPIQNSVVHYSWCCLAGAGSTGVCEEVCSALRWFQILHPWGHDLPLHHFSCLCLGECPALKCHSHHIHTNHITHILYEHTHIMHTHKHIHALTLDTTLHT